MSFNRHHWCGCKDVYYKVLLPTELFIDIAIIKIKWFKWVKIKDQMKFTG